MLTSVRSLLAATFLAGCATLATPAVAQDAPASDVTVSANAAVVSEYRFRGVDLSGGDVAIQGGIDVSHSSGLYVGTWGSSLDEDTVGYGHTELDVYGGWSGQVTDAVSLKVGVIAYLYPNAPPGDYDYFEGYGSASFDIGPASLTAGVAYAPKQDSLGSEDNFYVYGDASIGVSNTPVSLSGHLGYTDGFLTYTSDGNAFDWSLGADLALGENLSVGVAYVGAEGNYVPGDYRFTRDTAVFKVAASF